MQSAHLRSRRIGTRRTNYSRFAAGKTCRRKIAARRCRRDRRRRNPPRRVCQKPPRTPIFTQNINAKDVHLLIVGRIYKLNPTTKILLGGGYTTNALSDRSFSPALNNSGGLSVSGGIGKRISSCWINFGATGIFALNRRINPAPQTPFPGDYKSHGLIVGIGLRF